MSLRGFHILFISLATLFCAFFAYWAFFMNGDQREVMIDVIGWVCAIGVIAFPVYGVYFYKKAKNILTK
ncbi:hypothetical protein SAMN02745181_3093 [Rubritalea squalenifaciens DSM 18772]|uniref:Uncharacterized protein n=2 Tax=Rubritalea TaxID=361050 RepID=A0A1M6P6V9_9BACT|nr:hypothetical protein [Rubritalea squalenifaciens]SHK03709.1 hypothetical protein SAMN02745181_3093 [Rubritalea squalenifaciens DSM 18772]